MTLIDGVLATAVLLGLALNATLGWWWADPLAGFVIVIYGIRGAATPFALRAASARRTRLEPAALLEQEEEGAVTVARPRAEAEGR